MSSPMLTDGKYVDIDYPNGPNQLQQLRDSFQDFVRQCGERIRDLEGRLTRIEHGLAAAVGNGPPASSPSGDDPQLRSLDRWEAVKRRLGGKEAELIDVLLTAGPKTNTQLRPLLKLAYSTVCQLTQKVSNMGFIVKQGDGWALKQ